jgi:hypothetical protein
VRVEDDRITGGDDVDDVAGEGGDGVRHRQDGRDDAEGGVLLEGDAVVAAAGVGVEPLDAGDELHDLELLDLVVEAADLGLGELELAPLGGVLGGEGLDDLDNLGAGGDALLGELLLGDGGGGAGGGGVLEDAGAARGRDDGGAGAGGYGTVAAEGFDDLLDDAADERLIDGGSGGHDGKRREVKGGG